MRHQNLNLEVNRNDRIDPAEVTCPKVGDATLLSTPEYCTVLKTLFMVARISRLRVSPSRIVFESDMLFCTVPGPSMKFRGALPNVPQGKRTLGAGSLNAARLNHCLPVL
jgi:hypothetical protein